MTERRRAAIVIAVSDARPAPYLAGAVNGARDFHAWALAMGYDSRMVTDGDGEPVTVDRLKQELDLLLRPAPKAGELAAADPPPLHRLLIYFAGHGLIRDAEEGLWLLSDWHTRQRAVAVEVLRRRLALHDVEQIAIFADACRDLPPNVALTDLTPDGVLGPGPGRRNPRPPAVDKYIAAQDGAKTFAVPGHDPEDDRCVFSGVLVEALWGGQPEAHSKILHGKVTSRSLGAYLQTAVPQRAKLYGWDLMPQVVPLFPEEDDYYFEGELLPNRPVFKPWRDPTEILQSIPKAPRQDVRVRGRPSSPPPPPGMSTSLGFQRVRRSAPGPRPDPSQDLRRGMEAQRTPLGPEFSGFTLNRAARAVWAWPETEVTSGRDAHAVWIEPTSAERRGRSAQIIVEFDDGLFAPVVVVPERTGAIIRNQDGVAALLYRREGRASQAPKVAEDAIGKLNAGSLRADEATQLSVDLRQNKHDNPVLGVISAYLYDAIGDTDSIRRMAAYFAAYPQDVPFDVALLALSPCEGWGEDRILHIPAVPKRGPRIAAEENLGWALDATSPIDCQVAGEWPWLRQGWKFLDDPLDVEGGLIRPGLASIAMHLTPSPFTTLREAGGRALADLLGLERHTI